MPTEVSEAAADFDDRHADRVGKAEALFQTLKLRSHQTSMSVALAFAESEVEVRRNRFFLDEKYSPAGSPPKSKPPLPRRRTKWILDDSIWLPRKLTGNSKDFLETAESMRKMFDLDVGLALRSHGLYKHILKHDDEKGGRGARDSDGNGMADEVEEVIDAMWNNHRIIYGAFDYYACLYSEATNALGEADVYNISFNAFLQWTRDCEIADPALPGRELELMWVGVNAADRNTADLEKYNKANHMNRQEFIQLLVRIGIQKFLAPREGEKAPQVKSDVVKCVKCTYLQSTEVEDVSDGIQLLLHKNF